MSLRFGRLGLLVAGALLSAALAGAQPVAIEHQDVACIVAGQFPVLDACFRPGPGLARARVYFRPEGVPNWYYVDASAPAPPKVGDAADLVCRRATLPKPKKSLIEKHVEYYVDATGRKQESSQTETFRPLVVKSEGDCKKKVIAPFVPNAIVTVFPSLPAAFTLGGGLSGAAIAAVVGAGVAGGTGAVIAATNGGSSSPTTTNPPVATVPPATVPTTTTTTTLAPTVAFNPVFKVFKGGVLEPANTIAGTEPLQLRFFMCESTGPLPLKYNVLVNGALVTAGCDSTITFSAGGFAAGLGAVVASSSGVQSSGTTYNVVMRMQSDGPGNQPKASQPVTVDVSAGCGKVGPTSNLTSPVTGTIFEPFPQPGFSLPYPVVFTATTSGPKPTLDVRYYAGSVLLQTVPASSAPTYQFNLSEAQATTYIQAVPPSDPSCVLSSSLICCEALATVFAVASDVCASGPPSNQATIKLITKVCSGAAGPPVVGPLAVSRGLVSQLDVPSGRGQVVLNGSDAIFPTAGGRVLLAGHPRSGENLVEATLIQATGQPGLWRFELAAERSLMPGSLRVIAGQTALITPDAVVFRMKGRPGERVVFTFTGR